MFRDAYDLEVVVVDIPEAAPRIFRPRAVPWVYKLIAPARP
jgi:hypothetical protein